MSNINSFEMKMTTKVFVLPYISDCKHTSKRVLELKHFCVLVMWLRALLIVVFQFENLNFSYVMSCTHLYLSLITIFQRNLIKQDVSKTIKYMKNSLITN